MVTLAERNLNLTVHQLDNDSEKRRLELIEDLASECDDFHNAKKM